MKATTKCHCKSEFSQVFNFAILYYSVLTKFATVICTQKLVFYSIVLQQHAILVA